jgi:hypothetical protein
MLDLLQKLKSFISNKVEENTISYRILSEPIYDNILSKIITCYYLQKRMGLSWYNVIDRPFYNYQECVIYYSKLLEYIEKTQHTHELLINHNSTEKMINLQENSSIADNVAINYDGPGWYSSKSNKPLTDLIVLNKVGEEYISKEDIKEFCKYNKYKIEPYLVTSTSSIPENWELNTSYYEEEGWEV